MGDSVTAGHPRPRPASTVGFSVDASEARRVRTTEMGVHNSRSLNA